ncbi:MAG: 4Fe-4S dicluster domain-containing protein [Candidatus Lokiarchaeota archaeon]|nr:4Fe-4S dicluster domain-containing protein [Candidatus Lokiarchaeota archaeon]MBD3343411.1 4Fe-4S dicluster domain-containing protein [Candidatus Lokiarchaeota archaeon]
MSRKVLVFEPKKCVGCRLCEQACSMTHFGVTNPTKARIRIIRDHESQLDIATYCHQCIDAPCIKACKFEALSRDPSTHAILVDEEKCVGCRMCIEKCPYAAPTMHPSEKLVLICNLCGGEPACVDICPENAVQFLEIEKAANIRRSIYVEEEAQWIKDGVDKSG